MLVCGLLVVIIGLLCVVAAITQVTTGQRRLLAIADATAAASLEVFEVLPAPGMAEGEAQGADTATGPGAGTGAGANGRLHIDREKAQRAAREFLAETPRPHGIEDLRLESVTIAPDGITVSVRLSARVKPGLTAGLLPLSVGVDASGRARLSLSD